jgi:hypothetical protein
MISLPSLCKRERLAGECGGTFAIAVTGIEQARTLALWWL